MNGNSMLEALVLTSMSLSTIASISFQTLGLESHCKIVGDRESFRFYYPVEVVA